jgi:flagellar basal body-associated protein FliL
MPQIIPDDRARQGGSGRPVLGVLVGALALLAVAVTGYMIWVGSTSPSDESQDASRAAVTGSTSGNSNPSADVKPENPHYPVTTDPSANTPNR